jgi:hypothetical protein
MHIFSENYKLKILKRTLSSMYRFYTLNNDSCCFEMYNIYILYTALNFFWMKITSHVTVTCFKSESDSVQKSVSFCIQ